MKDITLIEMSFLNTLDTTERSDIRIWHLILNIGNTFESFNDSLKKNILVH